MSTAASKRQIFRLGYLFGEASIDFNLVMLLGSLERDASPWLQTAIGSLYRAVRETGPTTLQRLAEMVELMRGLDLDAGEVPRTPKDAFPFFQQSSRAIYTALEGDLDGRSLFGIGFRVGDLLLTLMLLSYLTWLMGADPLDQRLLKQFNTQRDNFKIELPKLEVALSQPQLDPASRELLTEAYEALADFSSAIVVPDNREVAQQLSSEIDQCRQLLQNAGRKLCELLD